MIHLAMEQGIVAIFLLEEEEEEEMNNLVVIIVVLLLFINTIKSDIVEYDQRSLKINGERKLMISGSIHYPRSTPSMWPSLIKKSKDAGINMIETYVFWNLHQPNNSQEYNFEGNANITHFLDLCQQEGLYVHLRIGPYVCAEWNYGGIPSWLRNIPGIVFRDYNQPWMTEMASWMTFIVNYLKPYFASNGGPIILAQVENEYGWLENEYGDSGKLYAEWAISFAKSLNIGIPWTMCQQNDIDDAINTCNGFYCHDWIQYHFQVYPNQPAFFTENWAGWIQYYSEGVPHRPTEDLLYSVARWFSRGGSLMNYYMWHGGTTFARYSSTFLTNSYDYDAALDEYGYEAEPKYSALAQLHSVLSQYSYILLSSGEVARPVNISNITTCNTIEIIQYNTTINGTLETITFVTNFGVSSSAPVQLNWNGQTITVNPWSVLILYNNQTVIDTSYVKQQYSAQKEFYQSKRVKNVLVSSWTEPIGVGNYSNVVTANLPSEQLDLTLDQTDYLCNADDMIYIYIDGEYQSWSRGSPAHFVLDTKFGIGTHKLSILSLTMGLISYGSHFESYKRGLNGTVTLGTQDITNNGWSMRPYLVGEMQGIQSNPHLTSWSINNELSINQPLTWYKLNLIIQSEIQDTSSFALDMIGMNKGFIIVNGNSIGRYWLTLGWGCGSGCNYTGDGYQGYLCRTGCGEPSERYYHVPNDYLYLEPNQLNEIIVFEELSGDPNSIQLVQRYVPYQLDQTDYDNNLEFQRIFGWLKKNNKSF
ncbi:glycoside hydrolase family 35 protein [Cavenderia fasciculata]|uniref:Beta-galactosidase n=1 Tax=Cavenderia fasciculata TaxID=261658 RepID=F4PRI6_CACFS|nr:glycoside hydrolase family 35 protein [Cavenderia fasciculata]EGG21326.1 glycoside hydrolase family 35 protein [Cavenderia fasciculata]|eukprot:XP_004359176.1 glycoside hydrolase family 35 protein [Cavenderia fasciculata]